VFWAILVRCCCCRYERIYGSIYVRHVCCLVCTMVAREPFAVSLFQATSPPFGRKRLFGFSWLWSYQYGMQVVAR
jgi:hypothetical protein